MTPVLCLEPCGYWYYSSTWSRVYRPGLRANLIERSPESSSSGGIRGTLFWEGPWRPRDRFTGGIILFIVRILPCHRPGLLIRQSAISEEDCGGLTFSAGTTYDGLVRIPVAHFLPAKRISLQRPLDTTLLGASPPAAAATSQALPVLFGDYLI